jgi:5-(carboxyamino)imidazole ribonucleotide synthase
MGDALGVIGGGQLGSYFVLAAQSMGFRVVVLEPDSNSPAGKLADEHIVAEYDDQSALDRLAAQCSAVTVEFENPPVESLEYLSQRIIVRPSPDAIAIAQDRRKEKNFCVEHGIPVAQFAVIESNADINAAMTDEVLPGILKTARLGYDGKGQIRVTDRDALISAFKELGGAPCVLEKLLPLEDELSIVLARGVDGEVVTYEATQNVHVNGVLDLSTAPINDDELTRNASAVAQQIATGLDYVGVLAVEFFVVGGELLVNELAPRPHNSGHWTLDAAQTSQFEQQVRTLVGMPLGATAMTYPAVAMVNLLGDRWANGEPDFARAAGDASAHLQLYGKSEAKPGRKMGHITVIGSDVESIATHAATLRESMTR